MSHNFNISLVNGLQGDPAVYCFSPRSGNSLLFDLGSLDALSNRDLLKVRVALVSHTHVDHFIGFDRLLRVNVPHGRVLELCGPEGFIDNVRGKLKGYCWNLLDPGQIQMVVHEVATDGTQKTVRLKNDNGFVPQFITKENEIVSFEEVPVSGPSIITALRLWDGTRVEAVILDHGTPVLAYSLQAPISYHLKVDALTAKGWEPGPWIKDLQTYLAQKGAKGEILLKGKVWSVQELAAEVFVKSHSRPIGYMTDLGFSRENLARVRSLMTGCDTLVCETNFADADFLKARQKKHLTTRQGALIAALSVVKTLKVFHISNVYGGSSADIEAEAIQYFEAFRKMTAEELENEVRRELDRVE